MTYLLYKLTCTATGKSYVGYTSRTLKWRWRTHIHYALKNVTKSHRVLLANAIRKHGVECWVRDVLATVETKKEALLAEIRLIAEHRTYCKDYPNNGYNMTPGGEWGPGRPRGGTLTPEHRRKIGDACRGLKRPDDAIKRTASAHRGMKRNHETREKIRIARTHQVCSDETRQKMSKTRKGRPKNPNVIAKYKATRARKRFQRRSHQWFMKP